jgi:hypothetical protein
MLVCTGWSEVFDTETLDTKRPGRGETITTWRGSTSSCAEAGSATRILPAQRPSTAYHACRLRSALAVESQREAERHMDYGEVMVNAIC